MGTGRDPGITPNVTCSNDDCSNIYQLFTLTGTGCIARGMGQPPTGVRHWQLVAGYGQAENYAHERESGGAGRSGGTERGEGGKAG